MATEVFPNPYDLGVCRLSLGFWGFITHCYRRGLAQIKPKLLISDTKCQFINNSLYKSRFFESPPLEDFQKTDFGVTSAFGAGNTKIGFIMRIANKFSRRENLFGSFMYSYRSHDLSCSDRVI
jgi:hypothetical protein